jgi:prephenate dehydrogenase
MADDFVLARSKIAILGLGLMGGSLALGLHGKCATLLGVDPHPATVELARSRSIVDYADTDPANLLPEADLVILAAPVFAILSLLEQLPSFTSRPCIVLDIGSTKQSIVEAMARLPERFDPIGGHPICGKESLSLANAEATLYQDAPFLLTPLPRTTSRALSAAHQIIKAIGARPMIVDVQEHDRVLASTSHLPFLLSSALALATPRNAAPFIGPGFKSTSRLAGTSASMMAGVLQSNRENVLEALSRFLGHLAELQSALIASDAPALHKILNRSQSSYHDFFTK